MSTPPPETDIEEVDTPTRVEIKVMAEHTNMDLSQIARETGLPQTTIQAVLDCPKVRREGFYDPEGNELISREGMRKLIAEATRDRQGRSLTWRELGLLCGLMCPPEIIEKAMKAKGYAKCKAQPDYTQDNLSPAGQRQLGFAPRSYDSCEELTRKRERMELAARIGRFSNILSCTNDTNVGQASRPSSRTGFPPVIQSSHLGINNRLEHTPASILTI